MLVQEVPLICLSRELAHSCSVPPAMYEGMAASCGSVGKSLLAAQRKDVATLFSRVCASDEATRDGLPRRCDRQWFADTFCSAEGQEFPVSANHRHHLLHPSRVSSSQAPGGKLYEFPRNVPETENVLDVQDDCATEDEIWASIDRLTCHAPLAVLACVPSFLQRHTEPTLLLTVLSAEHSVVRLRVTVTIRYQPTSDDLATI